MTLNIEKIELLSIDPNIEPTETVVRARVGYQVGSPGLVGPGEKVTQTREAFYESIRPQQIHYEISRRITAALLNQDDFKMQARQMLFPQVLQIVRQYEKPLSEGLSQYLLPNLPEVVVIILLPGSWILILGFLPWLMIRG